MRLMPLRRSWWINLLTVISTERSEWGNPVIMNTGPVAHRYAKALLKYVMETGAGEKVYSQACILVLRMQEYHQLADVLQKHPEISLRSSLQLWENRSQVSCAVLSSLYMSRSASNISNGCCTPSSDSIAAPTPSWLGSLSLLHLSQA